MWFTRSQWWLIIYQLALYSFLFQREQHGEVHDAERDCDRFSKDPTQLGSEQSEDGWHSERSPQAPRDTITHHESADRQCDHSQGQAQTTHCRR